MTWTSPQEIHLRNCGQCHEQLKHPKPFRPDLCHTHIEDDDEDDPAQCPHPAVGGGPFCEHHLNSFATGLIRHRDLYSTENSATAFGQDWCDYLHTAEGVKSARIILMTWIRNPGNADLAARMAEDITKRAIELGLETA